MATARIPSSVTSLKRTLTSLSAIVKATEWEKAALIYAWTTRGPLTVADLARLDIPGVRSGDKIKRYAARWADEPTTDKAIKPGSSVTLPDLDWEPFESGKVAVDARSYITRHPEVVREAIKAVPSIRNAVTEAVVEDEALQSDIQHRVWAKGAGVRATGPVTPAYVPMPGPDHNKTLFDAISAIDTVLTLEDRGDFHPNGINESMLRVLLLRLQRRVGQASDPVFASIDEHLKGATNA